MSAKEKEKKSSRSETKPVKEGGEELPEKGSDIEVLKKRGYSLENKIGEGVYGRVYIAKFTSNNKRESVKLACKVIDANKAPTDFVQKFLPREIKAMKKLRHENLVQIHSMVLRKNHYYIFLQFADKGDLLDFLKKNGALVEKQAKTWFYQMMKGVEYMHKVKYVHRDLKCENLLLSGEYVIKISDFGFAREWSKGLSETYCGSPSYSPPEIIAGTPYKPMPADIWSCGIILFVMMNKSMPFDYKIKKLMVELQNKKEYKFRDKVKERVSADLLEITALLLEPKPDDRPTAFDVLNNKWFKEMPVTTLGLTSGTVVHKTVKPAKKRKASLKKSTASRFVNTNPGETPVQKEPPKKDGKKSVPSRKTSPAPAEKGHAKEKEKEKDMQRKKSSHPASERKNTAPNAKDLQRKKSSVRKKTLQGSSPRKNTGTKNAKSLQNIKSIKKK